MPAPEGNKNALGNEGGRPPYFDASKPEDVERLDNLCEKYFDELTKINMVRLEGTPNKPPTVTGLSLFLGFDSKSTLYDYSKKVEFSHSIKKALTIIEQYHEEQVAYGDKCTGNIFVLKNFNWRDSIDHTTGGEKLPSNAPTLVITTPDGTKLDDFTIE